MTLEVFNEPWHYFGARGEGEGGEGRGRREMRRRRREWKKGWGGREMRRDSGSNKGADSQQMSHCHWHPDAPTPRPLTHTSTNKHTHSHAYTHTQTVMWRPLVSHPSPPSPLSTLCYETVWKGSDTNISFVHTGGSLSSLTWREMLDLILLHVVHPTGPQEGRWAYAHCGRPD